ncbi:snakin-2 [Cucumis sativus]|uniref:Snakin-2 n=1 Tax=Cucumis sativus TaxID=3659 RepID=A0A0A0LNS5_CUCSA|nr:snakin-2 [Cucumis sativus]
MFILTKPLFASLLLSLLFLHFVESNGVGLLPPNPRRMDCRGACTRRCTLSSRPRLCNRACGTCCQRCNCVPPGTSGNHHLCPCYAAMTTHGGRLKCP